MQNFDAVGLICVPLTAVQSPSRNRLQPANVVRRTVGAVGQMGLARHLDQASAYSPIIKARIRSLTSRARAEGVESPGSRKASRGALARLSKDYYYGWALGGAQGRSGHQYLNEGVALAAKSTKTKDTGKSGLSRSIVRV